MTIDRSPPRPGLTSTAPVSRRAVDDWRELAGKPLNFAPVGFEAARSSPDWKVDELKRTIGHETPGAPIPDGVFARARRAMIDYHVADPSRIRAVYDPAAPFCGRDMLLVGRFLFVRLRMGVRVGGVFDRRETGHPGGHVFGWHYRTLEGHLEQGQMNYRLRKDVETGEVEASIQAYSRRAPDANPILALGFAVVGRRLQLDFYDGCLTRLEQIVTTTG